jgi:hypothetical protein
MSWSSMEMEPSPSSMSGGSKRIETEGWQQTLILFLRDCLKTRTTDTCT